MKHIVLPVLIALLIVPSAAFAQGSSGASQEDEVPNLEGVWAQKFVTSSLSNAPLIGDVVSQTTAFLRVRISQSGDKLVLREQTCDVRIKSDQSAVTTQVPEAFVEHIHTVERPAELKRRDSGYHLFAPKKNKYFGVRPGDGELPRQPNNPRVVDQDKDGNPGMTIRLRGLLSGELHLVQQSWDQLWGKVMADGKIAGPVKWKTDQVVLQKTGRIVGEMSASKPHPDPRQSYFRMVRVEPTTTCAQIADKADDLF